MWVMYSVYREASITSSQGHVSYHACQLPLYSPETMPAASRQGLMVPKPMFYFSYLQNTTIAINNLQEPGSHLYQEDGIHRVGSSDLTGRSCQ